MTWRCRSFVRGDVAVTVKEEVSWSMHDEAKEAPRKRCGTADAWHEASDGGVGWSSGWSKSWTSGWSGNDADGCDEKWACGRGAAAHSWDDSRELPHGWCWRLSTVDASWCGADWHSKQLW